MTSPQVVRWKFDDVYKKGPQPWSWTVPINPNEGGSPSMQKQVQISHNAGPSRGIILQEGGNGVPTMGFSGIILTQAHYETFELWYLKRITLGLVDDLGRTFRGLLTAWNPTRVRKPFNPWYHTYSAEFQVSAYSTASGRVLYGVFDA